MFLSQIRYYLVEFLGHLTIAVSKSEDATCICSSCMSKVDAAARVFRVQGSSFLAKTCLDSPKKRVVPKKRLFNAIKKKGARATCNGMSCMSKVDAAARVFRVRGSSFLAKTCLDSPKKRVVPKKRLFNAIKKKGARATCNCMSCMSKVDAAARVFRVRGSCVL